MEPFIAEIRILPYNFAPKGWAWCDGQLMVISQSTALFSLVGTLYGGDGKVTFGLPNLTGRAPMHFGAGQGLTPHTLGEPIGSGTVPLSVQQLPQHNHPVNIDNNNAQLAAPTNGYLAKGYNPSGGRGNTAKPLYTASAANMELPPDTVIPSGGNSSHTNMQPYLAMNFCMALTGIFPVRS